MPSHVCLFVHFVWSTKDRRPLIDDDWSDRLYGYLGGILKNNNARLLVAGGMPDHIHLLASLPSTLSLAKAVNLLKSNSTAWVKGNIPGRDKFAWQEKYGAFSVSKSAEANVTRYIRRQKEHHRRKTFQEEFETLLHRHEIEFDERYVWQ